MFLLPALRLVEGPDDFGEKIWVRLKIKGASENHLCLGSSESTCRTSSTEGVLTRLWVNLHLPALRVLTSAPAPPS